MDQSTVDFHCKDICNSIKKGDKYKVICLNYLKNTASCIETRKDWFWIGHCLVMQGWLTINNDNNFQVK